MKFTINSLSASGLTGVTGTTIRIPYPGAESRAVYVNGQMVEANAWDDTIKAQGVIT